MGDSSASSGKTDESEACSPMGNFSPRSRGKPVTLQREKSPMGRAEVIPCVAEVPLSCPPHTRTSAGGLRSPPGIVSDKRKAGRTMEALTTLLLSVTSPLGFAAPSMRDLVFDPAHRNDAAWQPRAVSPQHWGRERRGAGAALERSPQGFVRSNDNRHRPSDMAQRVL
jgi:hypothetical protein